MHNKATRTYWPLSFLLLFLFSCGVEQAPTLPEVEEETVQLRVDSGIAEVEEEERPFTLYYHQLLMSLASGDATGFNGLIHPEQGCYLIEAPGAIPVMSRITDVEQALRKGTERSVLDFSNIFLSAPLTEETLPTLDCDSPDGFYSKEGTFVEDVNPLTDEQIWKYIGLEDTEQSSISELAKTVTKTVINTAGFKAYFSLIGDEWYLTFFDIRVPCSA